MVCVGVRRPPMITAAPAAAAVLHLEVTRRAQVGTSFADLV